MEDIKSNLSRIQSQGSMRGSVTMQKQYINKFGKLQAASPEQAKKLETFINNKWKNVLLPLNPCRVSKLHTESNSKTQRQSSN